MVLTEYKVSSFINDNMAAFLIVTFIQHVTLFLDALWLNTFFKHRRKRNNRNRRKSSKFSNLSDARFSLRSFPKGYVHYWANNDFLYHPINIELHLHTSYTHILHFQDARNTRLCLPCSHFKQKVKMTQNKNSKIYS